MATAKPSASQPAEAATAPRDDEATAKPAPRRRSSRKGHTIEIPQTDTRTRLAPTAAWPFPTGPKP